jgi:hypothetical protein
MENYTLKIDIKDKIEDNHFIFVLSNYLPIPESQAEQLVKLLKKNKTINVFTGYEKSDIEKYKQILDGFKIQSEVIEV